MSLSHIPEAPASDQLTLKALERALWDAACMLRAPVGTDRCKDYLIPLLFFKRLSDTWVAEHDQAVAEMGDTLQEDPEIEEAWHSFTIPPGCLWRDMAQVTTRVGAELYDRLGQIETANPSKLSGVFSTVAWSDTERLPTDALAGVMRALGTLDLSPGYAPTDIIGQAYEYLLRQFAEDSGQHAGEFYTPREVVRLLVRLIEPTPTDEVYDPTCGSGGMLLEAIQEVKRTAGGMAHRSMRLYGQEVRPDTLMIARINCFLHGVGEAQIRRGDTLRSPQFLNDRGGLRQFDRVLANPPFSLKNWGHGNWATDPWGRGAPGVPPKGYADFAFIEHMVASMKPDVGRCGIIMNHGVLFRGGSEAKIRQWLVESDILEAVIDIPRDLFYATNTPNSVFLLRYGKLADRRGKVLFIDGTKRMVPGKKINDMGDDDIDAIVEACQTGEPQDGVRCRLVDREEIAKNSYSLNFGIYLPSESITEKIDIGVALADWQKAHQAAEDAREAMERILAGLGRFV